MLCMVSSPFCFSPLPLVLLAFTHTLSSPLPSPSFRYPGWLSLSLSLWRLSLLTYPGPRNSATPAWSAQCGLTFYICACPRASKKRKRKIDDGKKVPLALFILLALFFFFLFFTHTLPTDWKTRENRHRWGNVTMVVGRQR